MTLESGKLLGNRYRIIEKLGEGVIATVYLSMDQSTREVVALKVLENVGGRQRFESRFRRKARILSQLRDAHIVRVFDFGVDGDLLFIVMEYAPGWTVAELVSKKGPLPVREALDIVRQTAEGLAVAWRKRITHLDIKPQNLMVDADGFVRIMDFGLAMTTEDLKRETGILDKPHYVSPEQVEGGELDVRADIYSLGVVLYEMLTGRILFDGDTPLEVAHKRLRGSVPSIRTHRPDIPVLVEQLVAKCLERKPADRFKSPQGLIRAVGKVMGTLPPPKAEEEMPLPPPAKVYAAVLKSAGGREYRLPAGKRLISVGRRSKKGMPDIDLSKEDAAHYVSRRHARISREGDRWYIMLDPEARGPTYVNQRKLTPGTRIPLKDGDKLRLAKVELTFRLKSG